MAKDAGIFVTLSRFTPQAREEGRQMGLTLVTGRELEERRQRVRRSEPCPLCGEPMRLDRSRYGWWFRCVSSGCKGKRDLASEPGRAVELLTQTPVASATSSAD
jgi:hypothetical protein